MRGTVINRGKKGKARYAIVLDVGHVTDPVTGKRKRKQKWISFDGNKEQAEKKLTELVGKAHRNEFVEPTKVTVSEFLDTWMEKAIRPPRMRQKTYDTYKHIIESRIKPALGTVRVQALQAQDIERYYADQSDLSAASLQLHHAILSTALKAAVRMKVVYRNVATSVEGKPRAKRTSDSVIDQSWSVDEARTFLATTSKEGPQIAAFYALALDSGARKGELLGLQWADIDLDACSMRIVRQLDDAGRLREDGEITTPAFGPTKTKKSRTINLGAETIRLLREHKRQQAELKMKNRAVYRDLGLVFAREAGDVYGPEAALGLPMPVNTLGGRVFKRLVKTAKVRPIVFHGLRHTCASLLMAAGEPMKVVQERLGHAKIAITMDTYAHVTPGMQHDAATRLGALLHG